MIKLIRFLDHSRETQTTKPMGCIGELHIDDDFVCYTMEQPWRNNRPFVSCVPVGEYVLKPYSSAKYGDVVALVGDGVVAHQSEANEGDRYSCLFHSANWTSQLKGCVAPGKDIKWGTRSGFNPNIMVTSSKRTLASILPRLIGESIVISWKN